MGKGESDMMYIAADKERCVILGTYIVENRATVRQTAARYGISKSTVHKDVTETLRQTNPALWESVAEVLALNKSERHLRGGEATKRRHLARTPQK
jgi:putative DeoR family transcriptional regulator (stage III sporulation protein D)